MERIRLESYIREEKGKNKVKKIRKENFVPACLYKEGKGSRNLKINKEDLYHALHTKAGENVIIDLIINGKDKKPRPVMIKEVQYHPIKDIVLHIDFLEISLTEAIKVNVPLVAKGTAEAVVKEDGAVEHIMWELEIECLPTGIPEKIEVEVTNLKIGDKIFVKDLTAPPGVKILSNPELIVLSAEPPHIEKPAEEAPEEEMAEPEVIAKGKKEEEGPSAEETPRPQEKDEKEKGKGSAA